MSVFTDYLYMGTAGVESPVTLRFDVAKDIVNLGVKMDLVNAKITDLLSYIKIKNSKLL